MGKPTLALLTIARHKEGPAKVVSKRRQTSAKVADFLTSLQAQNAARPLHSYRDACFSSALQGAGGVLLRCWHPRYRVREGFYFGAGPNPPIGPNPTQHPIRPLRVTVGTRTTSKSPALPATGFTQRRHAHLGFL